MPEPLPREQPTDPLDASDEALYLLDHYGFGNAWNAAILVVEGCLESTDVRQLLNECSSRLPRLASTIRPPQLGLGRARWNRATSAVDVAVVDVSYPTLTTHLLETLVTQYYGRDDPGDHLCSAMLVRAPRAGCSAVLLQVHHAVGDGATIRAVAQAVLSKRQTFRTRRHRRILDAAPPAAPGDPRAARPSDGVELVKLWRRAAAASVSPIPTGPSRARSVHLLSADRRAWGSSAHSAGVGGHELALYTVARSVHDYCRLRYPQLEPPNRIRVAVPFLNADGGAAANDIVVKVADVTLEADAGESLRSLRAQLVDLHRASWGAVSSGADRMLKRLPPRVRARATSALWNSMADAGLTSGQGPGDYVINGQRVTAIYVAPMALGVPVNVSKQLYRDRVSFGLTIDTRRIDSPDLLAGCFESTVEAIVDMELSSGSS